VPVILYSNLKAEDIAAYKAVLNDLNITRILHKPETRLGGLLEAVEACLAPAAA
jgi:hypothetical protein